MSSDASASEIEKLIQEMHGFVQDADWDLCNPDDQIIQWAKRLSALLTTGEAHQQREQDEETTKAEDDSRRAAPLVPDVSEVGPAQRVVKPPPQDDPTRASVLDHVRHERDMLIDAIWPERGRYESITMVAHLAAAHRQDSELVDQQEAAALPPSPGDASPRKLIREGLARAATCFRLKAEHPKIQSNYDYPMGEWWLIHDLTVALATATGRPLRDPADTCGGCGGPYLFDTTIDSEVWNRVVRPLGISEYLCVGCIVRIFAERGESFTAELWGTAIEAFNGLPIAVTIGAAIPSADVRALKVARLDAFREIHEHWEFADLSEADFDEWLHQHIKALRKEVEEARI